MARRPFACSSGSTDSFHTEIRKFELRQGNVTTGDFVFDLEVHYKRTPSHRGQRMRSTLHVRETEEPSPIFEKIGTRP